MHAAFVSPVLANSPITLHIPGKVIIDNRFVVTGFRSNFLFFLFDSLYENEKMQLVWLIADISLVISMLKARDYFHLR